MNRYILCLGLCLYMSSCLNDSFMDVNPKDRQTENTAFTSYDNFKMYSWGLYEVFTGYGDDSGSAGAMNILKGEYESDNMIRAVLGEESKYAYGKVKVEAKDEDWDYEYIRKVNLMLDNIDKSEMSDKEKEHWRSVGYFFRSYKYFQMMSLFGDIPWVEHLLNENSEELYKPRDSRDLVAENILSNLKYAEEHIKENGDGDNTINRSVVQALISRFGLFEGTWRKYHGLNDYETYLKASAEASEQVMLKYKDLNLKYEELFNSEDLSGVEGVLLYKSYVTSQLGHSFTRMVRTGESKIEMTKDAVDSYSQK